MNVSDQPQRRLSEIRITEAANGGYVVSSQNDDIRHLRSEFTAAYSDVDSLISNLRDLLRPPIPAVASHSHANGSIKND